MELDRFKVVSAPDISGSDARLSFNNLPEELKPHFLSAPKIVAIREPRNAQERQTVLVESIQGGRDYALRPDFYIVYEGTAALKSLARARNIGYFLMKHPEYEKVVSRLIKEPHMESFSGSYVPVVGREDWIAMLDKKGFVLSFLKGDGF